MAKQTFTTGQVLTAAEMTTLQANDYNQTVSAKVASYTLVAADAGTRITMSNASATTITVNTSLFTAGDTLIITNIGAGVCTITAGTATVSTAGSLALNQYDSGTLYFTSTGVSIWNGANPGDITAVTAGTGISGGGTSGAVTVTNSMATAITTNGDIIYGTGSGTFSRLGIGSSAQVLTVASGVPSWATPSSGSGMTSLATGSLSGGSTSITGISGSYNNLQIILRDFEFSQDGYLSWQLNADSGSNYRSNMSFNTSTTAVTNNALSSTAFWINATNSSNLTEPNFFAVITIYDYANAATYKLVEASSFTKDGGGSFWTVAQMNGGWLSTSTVTSVQINTEGSPTTFTAGSYIVYGVK